MLRLLILLALAGCASVGPDSEREVRVVDEESLLLFLDDRGITMTPLRPESVHATTTTGMSYRPNIGEGTVTVFVFESEAEADEGISVLRRPLWRSSSIFRRGRLVVVYQGPSNAIPTELESALGERVAT